MRERKEGETILFQPSPKAGSYDEDLLSDFMLAEEIVNGIRGIRQQKGIPPKEALAVKIKGDFPERMTPVVEKLAGIASMDQTEDFGDPSAGVSLMVRTVELFIILSGLVNVEEEVRRLEDELAYQRNFLENVRKKLGNASFVAHAPEAVVALERKKEQDSLSKIESLENTINTLNNC